MDVLASPAPGEWRRQAACKDADRRLFFPGIGDAESPRLAKAICATCPVKAECLAYAMSIWNLAGIWGGTSFRERRTMRNPRPLPAGRIAPLCECGCGEPVRSNYNGVWARWRQGHTRRPATSRR